MNGTTWRTVWVVLLVGVVSASARACLWDYDTLREEARGLPGMRWLIAGAWEQHSNLYYEHRVAEMRELIGRDPDNLPAIDNLAVALEKLGRFDEAIKLLEDQLDKPDPRAHPHYTTHANLGTFYLHRFLMTRDVADLDIGIAHIDKAVEINPDAHFGREIYQREIARFIRTSLDDPRVLDRGSFVLSRLVDPETMRRLDETLLTAETVEDRTSAVMMAMFQLLRRDGPPESVDEIDHAIEGVAGMIRFGTGTSPHLFHALGDLLAARGDKHHAVRAYLRAEELNHPRSKLLEELIESTARYIEGATPDQLRAAFKTEREKGQAWVEAYHGWQAEQLAAGRDPTDERLLAAFYAEHGDPRALPARSMRDLQPSWARRNSAGVLLAVGVAAVLGVAAWIVLRFRRRVRNVHATPAAP